MLKRLITITFILYCSLFSAASAEEKALTHSNSFLGLKQENDLVMASEEVLSGKKAPKITFIEYSSLSCPHCGHFHKEAFKGIKHRYIDTGLMQYIYRPFPGDKVSMTGSLLIQCANHDQAFKFLEILYGKQDSWVMEKNYVEILENIAKLGGMSGEKFHQCIENEEMKKILISKAQAGIEAFEIKGTPTFIINGDIVRGALPTYQFFNLLDKFVNDNKIESTK